MNDDIELTNDYGGNPVRTPVKPKPEPEPEPHPDQTRTADEEC